MVNICFATIYNIVSHNNTEKMVQKFLCPSWWRSTYGLKGMSKNVKGKLVLDINGDVGHLIQFFIF